MDAQTRRAQAFKALHEREGAFVLPNPLDAGSATMLASLGFEALATTSAGYAFSLGRPDGSAGGLRRGPCRGSGCTTGIDRGRQCPSKKKTETQHPRVVG